MRFHVTHPLISHPYHPDLVTGAGVVALARAAEVAGFDGYGFTDHPAPSQAWLDQGGHDALDPFVALGFVAAATTSLRLIPNIVVLPYRNPFVVAKASATLDVLGRSLHPRHRGRVPGGGVPGARRRPRRAGCPVRRGARRAGGGVDRRRRVVLGPALRRGGHHRAPRPVSSPHPPIWIGGNSAAARRRVALRGDGWTPFPAPRGMARFVGTAPLDGVSCWRRASPTSTGGSRRRGGTRRRSTSRSRAPPVATRRRTPSTPPHTSRDWRRSPRSA
ncbi:MAG: LLM class flavin-dependent oxidoreductase [Acidimicrobiales bacterium]